MSDAADRAQLMAEREQEHANRIQCRPALDAVECAECGDGIPPARRAAVPWSDLCVSCSEDAERMAALRAG